MSLFLEDKVHNQQKHQFPLFLSSSNNCNYIIQKQGPGRSLNTCALVEESPKLTRFYPLQIQDIVVTRAWSNWTSEAILERMFHGGA